MHGENRLRVQTGYSSIVRDRFFGVLHVLSDGFPRTVPDATSIVVVSEICPKRRTKKSDISPDHFAIIENVHKLARVTDVVGESAHGLAIIKDSTAVARAMRVNIILVIARHEDHWQAVPTNNQPQFSPYSFGVGKVARYDDNVCPCWSAERILHGLHFAVQVTPNPQSH